MVVVSNMACADRDEYDFADDLIEEAKNCEGGSGNEIDIDDIKLVFPARRKSPSRRYRDQCTSTSPDHIQHVPQDLSEAISMLQENARLISEMLANSNPQPRTEAMLKERKSAMSRSEMVQVSKFLSLWIYDFHHTMYSKCEIYRSILTWLE
jgi:hypothetical protein